MTELPSGTVTFLFTDLESSTRLWESHPEAMRPALTRHDEIVRAAIESHDGFVVKTTGDGFHGAFATAHDAVDAAVGAQLALDAEAWESTGPLRVRMGLHTCEAELRDGDYYGSAVNRAARLMSVAHGGQVVVSAVTSELLRDGSIELLDLGEHRLRDLGHPERVFQIAHPDLDREFPALQSVDVLPGNLPVQANAFVGRAALVEQVAGLVPDTPVVTLTGPGGVGKTRLALQVTATIQPEFPDGAWFADLAPVNDPDRVPAVLLEILGYTLAANEDDVGGLCARLRRRRLLLVVDNCEHLVASVAAVVDAISTSAPDVRVIATSREGLGIPAERVVPVAPLTTDAGGDAVQLFLTRARAAHPEFALDAETTPTVVELCRRLDGIPLAIELAAARTRSIAPARILERLDERFRMLTGGSRTAVARHQTLQAAVDWSYELLSEPERVVLDRLSVFAGGFTLDAAESVAGDDVIDAFDVLDHVSALVDKSLVVADPGEEGYRLLETIRQYAELRLVASGVTVEVRARHAGYYRSFALETSSRLTGAGDLDAFDRLTAVIENLRLMLDWHQDLGNVDVVADVVCELERFWFWRDHLVEMIARLDAVIEALGDDHVRLTRVHSTLALMRASVGYRGVRDHVARSAEHAAAAGIPTPALSFAALGTHYMVFEGDAERAIEQTELGAASARADGDVYWVAQTHVHGLYYRALSAPGSDETLRFAEQVRQEVAETGSVALWQQVLGGTAIATITIDPQRTLTLLEDQLEIASRAAFRDSVSGAELFRGVVLIRRGRYADAAGALRRSLTAAQDMGNRRGMLNAMSAVVGAVDRSGRRDGAVALFAGLLGARAEYGIPGSVTERRAEGTYATRLGHGATQALGIDATIDLAFDLLGDIAADGEPP